MSPPFRPRDIRQVLWDASQTGVLGTTGTDHCCFTTRAEAPGAERLHQNPQRLRRHRGAAARALASRRQRRAADPRTIRRADLRQCGQGVQPLAEKGFARRKRRRRCHRARSSPDQDLIGRHAAPKHRLFGMGGSAGQRRRGPYTLARGRHVFADGDLRAERGSGRYLPRKPFGPIYEGLR